MYQKFMFTMLMEMMRAASPQILEGIRGSIAKLAEDAKETENPWDDMLAFFLMSLVGRAGEPTRED